MRTAVAKGCEQCGLELVLQGELYVRASSAAEDLFA